VRHKGAARVRSRDPGFDKAAHDDVHIAMCVVRERLHVLLSHPRFPNEERHDTAVALHIVTHAMDRLARDAAYARRTSLGAPARRSK
jgi:hypothetical protein